MRRSIDEQRLDAERARAAVEQNAAVVLALRSQLEPEVGELPEGWTTAAQLRAAEGVAAGDCYDLVRLRSGDLGLIVVDIAGHGATEGILALRCKELLRASLAADVAPGDAVEAAAEQLGEMGPRCSSPRSWRSSTRRTGASGTPTPGIRPHSSARATTTSTSIRRARWSGRSSVRRNRVGERAPRRWSRVTTSAPTPMAVIEIRNVDNEFFGPERLRDLIRRSRCDEAPAIVKHCLDEAQVFSAGSDAR